MVWRWFHAQLTAMDNLNMLIKKMILFSPLNVKCC